MAYSVSSTRLWSCSFFSTLATWFCTVRCDTNSSSAISRYAMPFATRRSTSTSRDVSAGPTSLGDLASLTSRRNSPSTRPASPGVNTASPAAVRRTPSISSSLDADFTRYPFAPAFMARSTSSRSPEAEMTSTGRSGKSRRRISMQVAPSGSGILRSITTMSGRAARARVTHSVPLLATATMSNPTSVRSSLRASIHMGWSSTIITRRRSGTAACVIPVLPAPPPAGSAAPIPCPCRGRS